MCLHPTLHVRPATLEVMQSGLRVLYAEHTALVVEHARLQAQLDVLEANKKTREAVIAEYDRRRAKIDAAMDASRALGCLAPKGG